MQKKELIIR